MHLHLFFDSGPYHSFWSCNLLFKGNSFPLTFLQPLSLAAKMGAIMQPSQLSSLQTERLINEDAEITGAVGLGVSACSDMDQL